MLVVLVGFLPLASRFCYNIRAKLIKGRGNYRVISIVQSCSSINLENVRSHFRRHGNSGLIEFCDPVCNLGKDMYIGNINNHGVLLVCDVFLLNTYYYIGPVDKCQVEPVERYLCVGGGGRDIKS